MSVFKDADDVYDVIGEMFRRLTEHPELGPKLKVLDMSLQATYTNPDALIVLDCRNGQAQVHFGEVDFTPDAGLVMDADLGNKFWLGRLNLPVAMSRRQVRSEGKIAKVMKLLPIMRPAFGLYAELLREKGREDLIEAGAR